MLEIWEEETKDRGLAQVEEARRRIRLENIISITKTTMTKLQFTTTMKDPISVQIYYLEEQIADRMPYVGTTAHRPLLQNIKKGNIYVGEPFYQ